VIGDGQASEVPAELLLHLLLVALFGGVVSANDTEQPGRAVLYIETPEGQLAWPVPLGDEVVFGGLPVVEDYPWDGHGPQVRQTRLCRLIPNVPKLTYARPTYGLV
jgi:hypothetical protein